MSEEELHDKIKYLVGQLQNCVNYLEHAKRHTVSGNNAYDDVIDSANRAIYNVTKGDESPNTKGENNMNQECRATPELPRYKCHKEVRALKIKAIEYDCDKDMVEEQDTDGSAMITPEEDGYTPFRVDANYMNKHKPEVGGYYVVYVDGYESFSPAKAFENGYSQTWRSI